MRYAQFRMANPLIISVIYLCIEQPVFSKQNEETAAEISKAAT